MLTLRLGSESFVDLPGGESAEAQGEDFLVKDARGNVIARAEKLCVLAYGRDEIMHVHATPPRYGRDVFPRYELVRKRYLMLEEELHQLLLDSRESEATRTRLEGAVAQVSRVYETELVPLLEQVIQTLLSGRGSRGESGERSRSRSA